LSRAVDELQHWIEQLVSGDDGQAEAAVEGLASLGRAALPQLVDLSNSVDADDRWWAVRTIAAMDDLQIISPLLMQALDDPTPAVRQAAALGLHFHPNPKAIPALARTLADCDRLTAHLASDALAACGAEAIETLGHALQSSVSSVRIEAARALAGINDPGIVALLFGALDDSSASVSFWAELGLERLGIGMVFFNP
jgi:HEAT repeat protein